MTADAVCLLDEERSTFPFLCTYNLNDNINTPELTTMEVVVKRNE